MALRWFYATGVTPAEGMPHWQETLIEMYNDIVQIVVGENRHCG